MSTLDEIEAAAEKLPKHQQQEVLLFLARRLREAGTLPETPPTAWSTNPSSRAFAKTIW